MNIIRVRPKKKRSKKFIKLSRRQVVISLGIFLGLFLLINIIIWAAYRNKLYPNSSVGGHHFGNKSLGYVQKQKLVSDSLEIKTNYASKTIKLSDMGGQYNWEKTKQDINKHKPWLPLAGLFGKKDSGIVMDYDQLKLNNAVDNLANEFELAATNWSIDTSSGQAKLVTGNDGAKVDEAKLKQRLYDGIYNGKVTVPTTKVPPTISDKQLQPIIDQLAAKQKTVLIYNYSGKLKQATAVEILSFYEINGAELKLSQAKVNAFVVAVSKSFGITAQNQAQLTADTLKSLNNQTKLTATLVAAPKKIVRYTYCVNVRGVGTEYLPAFKSKLTTVLNDNQGWSLGGSVTFSEVASGCNFTAWLSAADQMPTFGGVCDSSWSCRSGSNVVINFNRWSGASDAWNQSGGDLEGYRVMVINHETGHWLGFGHRHCGGVGQYAPVMQQQSISLGGCKFSIWPNANEKETLKTRLGL